jgi:hypothetical protein
VSNRNSLRFLVVLLFAAFASTGLVLVEAGALGQNANSSTTGDDSAQNANMNMNAAPRRGRRGRRTAPAAAADANANTGDASNATAGTGAAGSADADMAAGMQTGDLSGDQTDLSGTYTGHIMTTGSHEMSGPGTLTITGNQFTLESGGMTHTGRVYAVTTRGYTGAALYFTDMPDQTTNTPVVFNVRARKSGSRLTLSPAPGATSRLTFGPGGRLGRGRLPTLEMPAAGGASNTGDTSMSGTGETNGAEATGTTTPAPRRGRRGSRRSRGTTNTNTNANSNTGDNSNTTPPM